MNQKTMIKGKIHYVGVNDRNKHLFEGLWPLPYGVSYNSYLIDDETVALIDTVDACYFEVYLRKIKSIIGERPIQYLIINHMEPDHSGSIRLIKQHYPDIVIVGNKQTFGMIEGYYGVTGEQYVVKDDDFLALGHHKLRFYLTPMVHWPETMMTFDETEGVLFSGDGFGCFGTLDGGFLDTRINTDRYWDEMVRYYSNIVGKYGSPVQKALQKLGGLHITTICSTHGPVWTEYISKVIGIYDKLSRYAADEGVVIAYGSMYGHTEQMAEAIAAELSAQGIKNIVMHNVSKSNPSYIIADIFKYRGLIIGSPTYSNQIYPDIESLLSKILIREVKGRYLGYFGSFTWAGAAVKRMAEFELEPFTKEEAKEVIRTIEKWQKKVYAEYGIHFIHAGDEWYLLAEEEVPEEERYDGYLQLENGVGMLRLLFNEFEEGYAKLESGEHQEEISLATAKLAYPYLERMAKKMEEKYEGLKVHTYCIRNDFFGERITVSGLITGQDLMKQLKDQPLGSRLLIPCNMLKMDEDIFLDDFTLKEVSDTLQVPIDIVKSSGQDLIDAILGVAGPNPTDIDENQMKDRRITTA